MKILANLLNLVPYHQARWEAVAARGHEVHLVLNRSDDDFAVLESNAASEKLEFHVLGLPRGKADAAQVSAKTESTLEAVSPDCVVVSGYSFPASIALIKAASARRIPVVVCSESNSFDTGRKPHVEWIKRQVLSNTSAAIVGGSPQHDYMLELGLPDQAVFLRYNSVDNDHFASSCNTSTTRTVFCAVARFTEKKNHIGLIRAFSRFKKETASNAVLNIAGDGPLRPEIEALIGELIPDGSVQLVGPVPYPELPKFYTTSSAFIHPSTTEQWGLVINEAMAAGLPVLVSDRCGCAPDLVEDDVTGRQFSPFDEEDIVAALSWFDALTDESRRKMGKCAKERIADWHPSRFAEELETAATYAGRNTPEPPGFVRRALLTALLKREEIA